MATVNLGAIKFNWKGAFNNSTAYAVDDVVSSGGSSYVCILASQGNVASNSTLTITPASTSSKFLILSTFQGGNNTSNRRSSYQIFRNGSGLGNSDMQHELSNGAFSNENPTAMQVYDHPNSTSATTYNVRYHCNVNGGDEAKINFKQLSIFEFAS